MDTGNGLLPVRGSDEMDRIVALPRRVYDEDACRALSELWTPHLLNARGLVEWNRCLLLPKLERDEELRRLKLRLTPEQAFVLKNFVEQRGVLVGADVGKGKTLMFYLCCHLSYVHFGCTRPVILLQATGKRGTAEQFVEFSEYWVRLDFPPVFESFESVRQPSNPNRLCNCSKCSEDGLDHPGHDLRPDFLGIDESDSLLNPETATTSRVKEFYRHHIGYVVGAQMTATLMRKSVSNFSRHMMQVLGFGAPIPISYVQLEEWCQATDHADMSQRRPVGALRRLVDESTLRAPWDQLSSAEHLDAVRAGMARRFAETPGVCIFDTSSCDVPLDIKIIAAPNCELINHAFDEFKLTASTLDDWPLMDAFTTMKYAGELGYGFYNKWDPRPPADWMEARKLWASFVRAMIKAHRRKRKRLDTEARVAMAYPKAYEYLNWQQIKDTFKPNPIPVSLSGATVAFAVHWIKTHGPALIWSKHTWIGETVARLAGIPYYGPGGETSTGHYIEDASGQQSVVLSLDANRRQRNLQMFHDNFFLSYDQSARDMQQALGRTHRQGQNAERVTATFLLTSAISIRALRKMFSEASVNKTTVLTPHKILQAGEWDWSEVPQAVLSPPPDASYRARWFLPPEEDQNEKLPEAPLFEFSL